MKTLPAALWQVAVVLAVAAALPAMLPAEQAAPRGGDEQWVATWGTAQQMFRGAGGPGRGGPGPARGTPSIPAAPSSAPAPAGGAQESGAVPAPRREGGPARRFGIPPSIPTLRNQTVRMIVRTSTGGRTLRLRLSNAIGGTSVVVGSAHVAIRARESAIVPGSDRAVTFSGQSAATLYAGATLLSDPVTLGLPPLSELAVSLYLPGDTGPPTSHTFGLHTTYISKEGDATAAQEIVEAAATTESYYWITGIDVLAPADAGTVVTFGDSITDGDQSTPNTNGAWPSVLAERLQANAATRNVGVVNAGISGNRILGDNTSGLARLTRDALGVPGVRWITLLEGINDITAGSRGGSTAPNAITAGDLIASYRQVIGLAHLHGVKVIGCTITPFGGSPVFNEYAESVRAAVNTWIRTSGVFDGVIDFDAATRDRSDVTRFGPAVDSPDLLHPANPGYKLMAGAIDLSLFRPARRPR